MLRDGEAALDVVQEAFARALRGRSAFRRDGNLESWLWQIVINLARDHRRRREPPLPRLDGVDNRPEVDDELRQLVMSLPERQRLGIFLRYYADLSYDQIAVALRVTPGTVAAALNAAHNTLRQRIVEVAR
jgi:RNA polymerase sigma-70 factor (ECF subfamily)